MPREAETTSGVIVPVYVYRRDDDSIFEIEQRMLADALLICPTTGGESSGFSSPSPRATTALGSTRRTTEAPGDRRCATVGLRPIHVVR